MRTVFTRETDVFIRETDVSIKERWCLLERDGSIRER